ncbi:molybdopterin converting factor subunit 1 [Pseudohongiella sp.]|uniref:Molybdopterin converting factor subunit 1 n=1 Tax=marine sediment metagenome TaxID=412755 RepID=A0A0F9Z0J5_9ZZZZ|nr:molybdopterin converting factor subunit 1 [Pseudohongiella sp.]HDZ09821.1 molybdopterin converting factor subunit 1 [Pseudohongiella sp.]HEA61565.1 molybdopterin converting factor subunit 1 [Pseudohongiella sp.]
MLSIHYFASVREALGRDSETIEQAAQISTVADLIAMLSARGGAWPLLEDRNRILVAVNQAVADRDQTLTGNEEIAFFPPMTGG